MRKSGNSRISVCCLNILKTKKGEVCYERDMGIGDYLDRSISDAKGIIVSEVDEQIKTYEPRADIDSNDIENAMDENGEINFDLIIKEKEDLEYE